MHPKIRFDTVYKAFDDKQVLNGVSFDVLEGETLVIIGRSGAGKSVILKHIVGLVKPDSGRVIVDDLDIVPLGEHALFGVRQKFGFLFQYAALLDSLTVGENVGLGLKERSAASVVEIRRIVREKLDMVGMGGTEDIMPADLSGGMKKRVGLARAIAMEPEIVLFDEPTTGLDPITADSINELIVTLKDGLNITSVVVTHDLVSARHVGDRFAMIHDGTIVYEGLIGELDSTDNELVRQFVEGRSTGPISVGNVPNLPD